MYVGSPIDKVIKLFSGFNRSILGIFIGVPWNVTNKILRNDLIIPKMNLKQNLKL